MIFTCSSSQKINNLKDFKSLFFLKKIEEKNTLFFENDNNFYFFMGTIDYVKDKKKIYFLKSLPKITFFKKYFHNSLHWIRNNLEGRFIIFKYNVKNGLTAISDINGQRDLYFRKKKNKIILSDNILELKNTFDNKNNNLNQISLVHVLNVYASYTPKKITIFKNISRLGHGEYLEFSKKLIIKSFKTILRNIEEKNKIEDVYFEIMHNSIASRTSEKMNWVLMSSGWDTSFLLNMISKTTKKNKITCVIGRVTYSKNTGPCNSFEIIKAKKMAKYFGVKLVVKDIDWTKKTFLKKLDYFDQISQSQGIFTLMSYNFYYLYEYIFQKASKEDSIFNGDYSDSVHNFGFSQSAGILNTQDKNYREYFDKMCTYLYSPDFLTKVQNNSFSNDPIFNSVINLKNTILKQDTHNKLFNYLAPLFLSKSRVPFTSVIDDRILTKVGKKKYLNHIYNTYFKEFIKNLDTKNIYSVILQLYKSFHWQSGTVKLLCMLPEYKSFKASTPFSDNKFIEFMETVPQKYGRGLEMKPAKFLLKKVLMDKLNFSKNLQSGPHSYLYDTDPTWNVNNEILYKTILNKKFKSNLRKSNFCNLLDNKIFNIKFLKKIMSDYQDGKISSSKDLMLLLNLLGVITILKI
tara:strand:- start:2688 stop:4583 length:1896 start_codon:yes stop_codon:yes gene_type:complete